jgi:hypothetical protein
MDDLLKFKKNPQCSMYFDSITGIWSLAIGYKAVSDWMKYIYIATNIPHLMLIKKKSTRHSSFMSILY